MSFCNKCLQRFDACSDCDCDGVDVQSLREELSTAQQKLEAEIEAHGATITRKAQLSLKLEAAEANSKAVPEGMVLIRMDVVEFLNGSRCNDDGLWFGEDDPETPGKFWWRSMLPRLAATQSETDRGSNETSEEN